MLFQKCAQLRNHARSVLPRRRHYRQHRFGPTKSSPQVDFECIIEAGRIADTWLQKPFCGGKLEFFSQCWLLRSHPSAVGADGVDFTIVGDEPKWLGQGP